MKQVLISLVGAYQQYISPLFPPTCRYYPTCSHYTVQALEKHGALKGSVMGISRILRCNPLVAGGIDKVPDYFTVRRNPANAKSLAVVAKPELTEAERSELEAELAYLKEEYQAEMVIHDHYQTTSQTLADLVDVHPLDLADLPEEYIERVKSTILSLSDQSIDDAEALNLKLFRVEKNAKSQKYYNHLHPEFINNHFQDDQAIYLLVEEDYGVYYSTSPELGVDIQLQKGITQEDMAQQTSRYVDYLYLLEAIYD